MKFKPSHDDKLRALIRLLKTDPILKKNKVLIFSEFMATARYLKEELKKAGIEGVDEIDSADGRDRGAGIRQFAPYYNGSSRERLQAEGLETRVLISTDVLSEGLNLQWVRAERRSSCLHATEGETIDAYHKMDRPIDARHASWLTTNPPAAVGYRLSCGMSLPEKESIGPRRSWSGPQAKCSCFADAAAGSIVMTNAVGQLEGSCRRP